MRHRCFIYASLITISIWTLLAWVQLAHGAEEPWRRWAALACAKHGCEAKLLVAIALAEQDERGHQSVGDGVRAIGRWQVHVETGLRVDRPELLLGPWPAGRKLPRGKVRKVEARDVANMTLALSDDIFASDLAARILVRCAVRNRTREYKLRCYNNAAHEERAAAYAARVMGIYEELD